MVFQVWYAAITQCFFSLAVCFGNLIMYASFNRFDHNVYRDATIVTSLDTFTSLLAGFTIFGILGHLAHVTGAKDIGEVVKGGAGLAFISYPDAIGRFQFVPQVRFNLSTNRDHFFLMNRFVNFRHSPCYSFSCCLCLVSVVILQCVHAL